MTLHESLSKILTSLQHGSLLAGTYYRDGGQLCVGLEVIIDTLHQRILGAYHHHIDIILQTKVTYPLKIIGRQRYIGTHTGCACITRRNEQLFTTLALCYLPC